MSLGEKEVKTRSNENGEGMPAVLDQEQRGEDRDDCDEGRRGDNVACTVCAGSGRDGGRGTSGRAGGGRGTARATGVSSVGEERADVVGDGDGLAIGTSSTLVSTSVGSVEHAGVEDVLDERLVGLGGDVGDVQVGSPVVCRGVDGHVVDGALHLGDVGVLGGPSGHHRTDGRGGAGRSAGRVDDTEHALLAMGRNSAVEERGLGVVHNLVKDERGVLLARGKGRGIGRLVADGEGRRLGDGVRASSPHEADGVSDRGVDREGHVAEDTLGGCYDDGVGRTSRSSRSLGGGGGRWGRSGRRRATKLGLAHLHTAVQVSSPVGISRTVRGRSGGSMRSGSRCAGGIVHRSRGYLVDSRSAGGIVHRRRGRRGQVGRSRRRSIMDHGSRSRRRVVHRSGRAHSGRSGLARRLIRVAWHGSGKDSTREGEGGEDRGKDSDHV